MTAKEPFALRPRRAARLCCRIGLHFMSWDFPCDGYYCECRRQFLHAEQIRGHTPWRVSG